MDTVSLITVALALLGPPGYPPADAELFGDAACDDFCIAASVFGDASACRTQHSHVVSHWPYPDCVAVSATGDASCTYNGCWAVSATGHARGTWLEVSGCDAAGLCADPA